MACETTGADEDMALRPFHVSARGIKEVSWSNRVRSIALILFTASSINDHPLNLTLIQLYVGLEFNLLHLSFSLRYPFANRSHYYIVLTSLGNLMD